MQTLDLDVWRMTHDSIDLNLSPSQLSHFRSFLPPSSNLTLFIPSLQDLIDQSTPSEMDSKAVWDVSTLSTPFHDSYHSLEEMDVFGDELAAKFGPLGIEVEKFSVGQSWEGREIRGWKARAKRDDKDEDGESVEREFVVQSGQHAREVSSLPTYILYRNRLWSFASMGPGADYD